MSNDGQLSSLVLTFVGAVLLAIVALSGFVACTTSVGLGGPHPAPSPVVQPTPGPKATPPPGTMGDRNSYWQQYAKSHHLRIPTPSPKARATAQMLGADISEWQGPTNLGAFSGSFILIREGVGTRLDHQFVSNRDQARRLGLPHGFYWYAYPEHDTAEAEATDFATWTDWQAGELAVLDIEEPYSHPVSWALQFVQTFAQLRGFKPLIYMSQNELYAVNWSAVAGNGNGLWEAKWDGSLVAPASGAFAFAAAKQYTDATSSPGISGRIDGDVFYGTAQQWAAYGQSGIVPGPSPSPSPTPQPQPQPAPACIHVVQPGDTLWDLVDGSWASVAAANGLANPNLIYPGQTLNLCARASTPAPANSCVITVQPGDTLSGLVGSRWPEVAAENGIRNPNLIYPGEKIRVCGGGGSVATIGVGCVIVRPGDTLSGLFDGRWPEVAVANGIRNPNLIFPGQRICG
jgi:lysozyme